MLHLSYFVRRSLFPVIAAGSVAAGASAATVDLTTPGASATINGAIFTQTDLTTTQVGAITPFLRLQGPASGTAVTGYNTDARPLQFNEKAAFTQSILLSSVPIVIKDGIAYREILLNNREPAAADKHLISLDNLSIFLSPTGSPTGVSLLNPAAALGLPVYSLDAGGDNEVVMDAALSKGHDHYDISIDIPVDAFPVSTNTYLTLLAVFGLDDPSSGGFEEFAIGTLSATLPCPIPLPAASATGLTTLLLLAAFPAAQRLRRRRRVQCGAS